LGWDAKRMFVVYAMETLIVGIINVLKMMVVTLFVNKNIYGIRQITQISCKVDGFLFSFLLFSTDFLFL
jgi:hypothetical protein